MYNAMSSARPPVGSVLTRPKFPFTHRGIYMGNYLGFDQVFENTLGHGERLVPFAQFANGNQVSVERQVPISVHELIARVREAINGGRPYDPFTNNCDHAVTRVADGEPVSLQALGWVAAILVIGVVAVGSSKA